MATTAIFAEIVIVGLEAAAWIMLAVLTIAGADAVHPHAVADFAALATLLVIAAAYVLGIFVDRLADSIFGAIEYRPVGLWLNRKFGECSLSRRSPASVSTMRLAVMKDGGAMGAFLDYQRSRMRIARGTALNLAIALPLVAAFTAREAGAALAAAAALATAIAMVAAVLASERVKSAWFSRLSDAYKLLKVDQTGEEENVMGGGDGKRKGAVVATVPFRRSNGSIEFLVVRARGCTRWTFPKGHVKKHEEPADAARRETEEEAGVTGATVGPFGAYLYGKPGAESAVAAFLLEYREDVKVEDKERWRTPAWGSLDDTLKRLQSDDENPRVRDEHKRILETAADAIESRLRARGD